MNLPAGFAWGAAAAAVVASSFASIVILRRRSNPRDKERLRRESVSRSGRVIEGYVSASEGGVIQYSYHWRGVRYEASQDVSDLAAGSTQFDDFSGPVTVKFLGSQPSNSILVAESWTGIPKIRASE
jgi:hypothetical protein